MPMRDKDKLIFLFFLLSLNNTRISGCQRQIRDLESEIQRLTDQHANRNTEQEKLAEFNQNLQEVYKKLADKKEEVMYHDFAYSLLKDDGVKTKIIFKVPSSADRKSVV